MSPHEAGDVDATEAAIRRAIDALPERCREVFLLSREHGLPYSAIAATMDISIKTVETQMGRALKALRGRWRRIATLRKKPACQSALPFTCMA